METKAAKRATKAPLFPARYSSPPSMGIPLQPCEPVRSRGYAKAIYGGCPAALGFAAAEINLDGEFVWILHGSALRSNEN